MGNTIISKFALPGVHSYTCPVNDEHIQSSTGDDIKVISWLHPSNGTEVEYSESSIPLLGIKKGSDTVIIYSHGNAEDVSMTVPWLEYLSDRFPVDVLAYDYTGYGTNYCPASNESIHHNALSVLKYVKMKMDYKKIFLYGRSIGTAPAIFAAVNDKQVDGVILQSAFCSIVTTRVPIFMQRYIPKCIDMLFNGELLGECETPVLLIHGKEDKIVPFDHGLALSKQKCVWSHCWIDGAGQNNIETISTYRDEMCASIDNFISFVKTHT